MSTVKKLFRIFKMIATSGFLTISRMHHYSFSARALPRTLLGELTVLPQTPLAGLRGTYF